MIAILDGLFPAWRLAAIGIAIVSAVSALGFIAYQLEQRGADRATTKIERANNVSNDKATAGGDDAGQRFDACIAAGRHWDRANLVCDSGAGK